MIFTLFYNFFLCLFCFAYLPKFIYLYFSKDKYTSSIKQRFGFDFPIIDKNNKPLVWVHAVSVGETRAVAGLCKLLSKNYTLLVSSITETGHAEAKRALPFADYHVYLPLDLKIIITPIINKVSPEFVVISETDLWYHFLKTAKENGAQTVVVNGKISDKSYTRLKLFTFFTNRLYSLIDLILVQNTHYEKLFKNLGVKSKLEVTGNLKFDEQYTFLKDRELEVWKKRLGIKDGAQVLVAGSTHDPEECLVLDALKLIWKKHPDLKVLIVPRHPERFDIIEKELIKRGISYCRFSGTLVCDSQVVLIDAMGLLRQCYQVSTLAIVGGSFTEKVGGHNILEPLFFGVPVIFGPCMHSQPDMLKYVLEYEAGLQINEASVASTIDTLLDDGIKREVLAKNGFKLISNFKGSTKNTFEVCEKLFNGF
jgi:3-deoxy-D-manno-octulosonic-acid transferase